MCPSNRLDMNINNVPFVGVNFIKYCHTNIKYGKIWCYLSDLVEIMGSVCPEGNQSKSNIPIILIFSTF